MAKWYKNRQREPKTDITPVPGMRVIVVCEDPPLSGLEVRKGTITAINQGVRRDMFVVNFDKGHRESFRKIDLRIGEVRMLAV